MKYIVMIFLLFFCTNVYAQTIDFPNFPLLNLNVQEAQTGEEIAFSLQLLLWLAILSLAPSIIIMMTSFLRIALVLDFVRRALSLQQMPPNQVIMGIALFLTVFIMWPTFLEIYDNAYKPLATGELTINEAYDNFINPLRHFMYLQMERKADDVNFFMNLAQLDNPESLADVPTYVLIPAFMVHELKAAFIIGIILFLPFIAIDMIVASILMSMGMIMLPPVMISLPFKIMLFVLVDGWKLIIGQLLQSFHTVGSV